MHDFPSRFFNQNKCGSTIYCDMLTSESFVIYQHPCLIYQKRDNSYRIKNTDLRIF